MWFLDLMKEFYKAKVISEEQYQTIQNYFVNEDGIIPENDLLSFCKNENLLNPAIGYIIARYVVYRGISIATKTTFFSNFQTKTEPKHPGILFWQAYDALLHGKISLFSKLWNQYCEIDLKTFQPPLIFEAYIIPESPIFILVEHIIHPQQRKLITWIEEKYLNIKSQTKVLKTDNLEKEKENLPKESTTQRLVSVFGHFSHLLAFFQFEQTKFKRSLTISDLQAMETLLTDEKIVLLDTYWELYILTAFTQWRLNFSLLFEATESLTTLKETNSVLMNSHYDTIAFILDAQIAFLQNNPQEALLLLQSAEYLATSQDNKIDLIRIWELKAAFDSEPDSTKPLLNKWIKTATKNKLDWLKAKGMSALANYSIQEKNWEIAEKYSKQALTIFSTSIDEYSYLESVSNYDYLLLIQRKFEEAIEYASPLIEITKPILFQLRGAYLQSLAYLSLSEKETAIEILEEGIRLGIHNEQPLQLPWFYELLGMIYVMGSDWRTAAHYFNLAAKNYIEVSRLEQNYRAKLAEIYVTALDNNHGRSFTQIQNFLASEVSDFPILLENLWANQSILLVSKENIPQNKWNNLWKTYIESNLEEIEINAVYWSRSKNQWNLFNSKTAISALCSEENKHPESLWTQELIIWNLYAILTLTSKKSDLFPLLGCLEKSSLSNSFTITKSLNDTIQNLKQAYKQNNIDFSQQLKIFKTLLIRKAFVIAIQRVLEPNLPFPELL